LEERVAFKCRDEEKSKQEAIVKAGGRSFLLVFFLDPEDKRGYVPPKRRLTFQRITPRYISEERTFHNHGCESLKSYILA
jgi:hypothetical protein